MKDFEKVGDKERHGLIRPGYFIRRLNRIRKMFLYGYRYDSAAYIRKMNHLGARIDDSVMLYKPETIALDSTMPFLLEIGRNVHITAHVNILTHDGVWMAMKGNDGRVMGHVAPVKIGDNVFIGRYCMILCGVTICDNVILGAGSVVSSSIDVPGVYAGCPARLISPYEQYRERRQQRQADEAYVIAERYYERFHKMPPQEIFAEYFWLFAERNLDKLPPVFLHRMTLGGSLETAKKAFLDSAPVFEGYEAFCDWCIGKFWMKENSTE